MRKTKADNQKEEEEKYEEEDVTVKASTSTKGLHEFIESEKKALKDIAMSKYSIYSKPQIDSQHVQNIISCSIKIKQTKANQEIFQTSVYQTYHDLKAKSFPRTDLERY